MTHIFAPLMLVVAVGGLASRCVLIAATSEPSSGSLIENAARISPVAIFGSNRACCSGVPNFISR